LGGKQPRPRLARARDLSAGRGGAALRAADLAANVEPTDHDYLAACSKAEADTKRGKRLLLAGIYVLLVGVIAGLIGWINQSYIGEQWRWWTVTRPGDDQPGPINIGDEDLSHMSNWFECLRAGNRQTNATVDHGFLRSVACIMAAQSYWSDKRLYYDAKAERISDTAP
jgi:hypothetical protein